ncbi:MAG: IS110 family transposase, partial [Cytophagales bacterium]
MRVKKHPQGQKFACYCGVVPFEHSSGKFRGKNRVSKMANLKL